MPRFRIQAQAGLHWQVWAAARGERELRDLAWKHRPVLPLRGASGASTARARRAREAGLPTIDTLGGGRAFRREPGAAQAGEPKCATGIEPEVARRSHAQ
eukprot:13716925-Alexandrium_andersonii.AAC.1